ncbi:MAG: protein-disulfide reductase DsbD [Legionella sp.]
MGKKILLAILMVASFLTVAAPPRAQEVFQLTTNVRDFNSIRLNWHIKKGFFLYKDRISIQMTTNPIAQLGVFSLPVADIKNDLQQKNYAVYRDQLQLIIPVLGQKPGETTLDIHYQGCSKDGFCYPPQTKQIKLTIDKHLAVSQVVLDLDKTVSVPTKRNDHDRITVIFNSNLLWIILSFFGLGLLLAFTPCVLPMVPILSGIIVGYNNRLSTYKAFLLSLSYVLGMSLTYALIGGFIALLGNNLQMSMQSPWIVSLFSSVFVLLALSLFDVYELKLPMSWQTRLANLTRNRTGGDYLSTGVMGCLSILIVSPCVTAPLLGVLSYIGHNGNIVVGLIALFFLGLGMGTPLLLIGTSAGKLLPKSGSWMVYIKSFFGVLMLAIAIYLMEKILQPTLIMFCWASLFILCGIYIGGLQQANTTSEKLRQGLGILLFTYGLLILIGSSMGHQNPWLPLKSDHSPLNSTNIPPVVVKTMDELTKAIKKSHEKPMLVDFYADWCASCKLIESTIFTDPQVQQALLDFTVLKVDLTANNQESTALLNYFNVIAPPTFIFINKEGQPLKHLDLVGEISSITLIEHLKLALQA